MDSKLVRRITNYLHLKGLSTATEKSYLRHIYRLKEAFPRKDLQDLTFKNVLSYLINFKNSGMFSVCYYRQARAAIVMLYKDVIKKKWPFSDIPPMKIDRKLPDILSTDEIRYILDIATHPRDKAIISLLYSAGLRITEACNLRIKDIDSNRMMIHIRQTKSRKDRFVMLSPVLLQTLRAYYRSCITKPKDFLFPNSTFNNPIARSTAWYRIKVIMKKSGLKKRVYPHVFRHSFATHLLENGVDLRSIQSLLGHCHLNTTAIYTHLAKNRVTNIISPLDTLISQGKEEKEVTL